MFSYSADTLPLSIAYSLTGLTFSYTYENASNLKSVSDGAHTEPYSYDAQNRLIQDGTATYTYDGANNFLGAADQLWQHDLYQQSHGSG